MTGTPDAGDGNLPRTGDGRFTQRPDTAQRDAEACRLRTSGASYDRIAQVLGFHDRSGARRAVMRALAAVVREPAEEVLQFEDMRLDDLTEKLNEVLTATHYVVTPGGKIVTGPDGQPLVDTGAVVQAALALLRVHESRRRLHGTDAPVKARIEVIDDDVAHALAVQMEADLAEVQREATEYKERAALPPGQDGPSGLEAAAWKSLG